MLLVGLYLIQHYKHFGLSGIIPIAPVYSFICYSLELNILQKKQIVAQISANSDMVNQHKELITLSHGLKAIYLGNEPNSIRIVSICSSIIVT